MARGTQVDENEVVDTPTIEGVDDTPTPEAETSTDTPAEGEAAAAKAPKRAKTGWATEEGYCPPVEFAKKIDEHLGQAPGTTPPQMVYGYVKNGKDFPSETDEAQFPKVRVNVAAGLEWIDAKQAKKAEKAAAAAAQQAAHEQAQAAQTAEEVPAES
jgi:hypothetical protein